MRTSSRARALAVLLVLTLASLGCSLRRSNQTTPAASPGSFKYGDPNSFADASPAPGVAAEAPEAQGGAKKSSGGSTSSGGGTSSGGAKEPTIREIIDFGGLGDAARPILAPSPYPKIIVEIDWVDGRAPTQGAKDLLVQRLKEATGGKEVVFQGGNSLPASDDGEWSEEEMLNVARARDTRSVKDKHASIFISYLDGGLQGTPPVPPTVGGQAYRATIASFFPDRLVAAASREGVSRDIVEKATLIHEVGHILALINIGYKSPRDHEDPESPGHSKNRQSVMYSAIAALNFDGPPSTTFDQDDLADLHDLGSGKL